MIVLSAPVGKDQGNDPGDVYQVQIYLNDWIAFWGDTYCVANKLKTDGLCGPKTIKAIKSFQRKWLEFRYPDGVIDPEGPTAWELSKNPQEVW